MLDVTGIDHNGDLAAEPIPSSRSCASCCRSSIWTGWRRASATGCWRGCVPAEGGFEARPLRILPRQPREVTGIVEQRPRRAADPLGRPQGQGRVRGRAGRPGRCCASATWWSPRSCPAGGSGLARAKVTERVGRPDDPAALTLMTAVALGLPTGLPARGAGPGGRPRRAGGARQARGSARACRWSRSTARTRATSTTRCGPSPIETPDNPGGHRLLVAIADVAHYVRPDNALDREAPQRGNSVYFPDRVIPMLPEALSNDLCSLRPRRGPRLPRGLDRRSTARAQLRSWRFCRGLMRSAGRG